MTTLKFMIPFDDIMIDSRGYLFTKMVLVIDSCHSSFYRPSNVTKLNFVVILLPIFGLKHQDSLQMKNWTRKQTLSKVHWKSTASELKISKLFMKEASLIPSVKCMFWVTLTTFHMIVFFR